jgi:hypothetical protein
MNASPIIAWANHIQQVFGKKQQAHRLCAGGPFVADNVITIVVLRV